MARSPTLAPAWSRPEGDGPGLAPGRSADGPAAEVLSLPWLAPALAQGLALRGSHALLIHGAPGMGQLALAGLLAQAALCQSPTAQGAACGRCDACHRVHLRTHPDLRVLQTDAERQRLDWTWPDDGERAAKAKDKPSKELKVGQVREAIGWSQQTSSMGRGKVILLQGADAMNAVAANALLKTLEEPPGSLRLLLTCDDPEQLLPTVRSRCQRLPVFGPQADQAMQWLCERGLATQDAAALLQLAGGSPLGALAWAADGLDARWLTELPLQLAAGDATVLAGRPVAKVLALLARVAHDAAALAVGGQARYLALARWPDGAQLPAVMDWQQTLRRVARHADHPWQAPVLLEALVGGAAAIWPAAAAQPAAAGRGRG